MSNKSPIFHMPHSQHFSDYGFDPQIDYFKVFEESKNYKNENWLKSSSIDALQFKVQKPIPMDDLIQTTLKKKKKRWFWKKAFIFLNCPKWPIPAVTRRGSIGDDNHVHMARARNFRAMTGSMSRPVYVTESWSGLSTPYRTMSFPYMSVRELNMEQQQGNATSSMSGPVYLVT